MLAARVLRLSAHLVSVEQRVWVSAVIAELPDIPPPQQRRWAIGGLQMVGGLLLKRPRTYVIALVVAALAVACTLLPTLGILLLFAAPTALGGMYSAWANRRLGGWLSDGTRRFWRDKGFKD